MNEPSPWVSAIAAFFRRLWQKTEFLVIHTFGMAAALGTTWLIHLVLKWSFGLQYKLLGFLPVVYALDLDNMLILSLFFWHLLQKFRKP